MATLRVVHVTDFHLFADETAQGDGVVPAASCARVLSAAAASCSDPDAVILSGDFSQDATEASYVLVKRLVRTAFPSSRVFFVPGNHDEAPDVMARVLLAQPGAFVGPSGDARLLCASLSPSWDIFLLSTPVPHSCPGRVPPDVVESLRAALEASVNEGKHGLLVLHHPPVAPAGEHATPWGGQCLLEPEGLLTVLRDAALGPRVALHGHLHAELSRTLGRCVVYSTPSTCNQVFPVSPVWATDHGAQPGYRVLTLLPDGEHTSSVTRVDVGADSASKK